MLNRIITKIKTFNNLINNFEYHKSLLINSYCNSLIKTLDNSFYLPFTSSSISPFALAYFLNEITINDRKSILEFGAGISTIILARFNKKFNESIKITSIEEDENWLNFVKNYLVKENLVDQVNLILAPLSKNENSLKNNLWYNEGIIKEKIREIKFDMVIIDGPQAHLREKLYIRYTALPFIKSLLENNYVIFLDDAQRKGEQMIINNYAKKIGYEFHITNNLAVCYSGNYFNCAPL